jgi:opacity protein-like surface antigen
VTHSHQSSSFTAGPTLHCGWVRLLLGCAALAWSGAPCAAASPRTGDIAFTAAVGAHSALGDDDFGEQAGLSAALDFHWTARNSLRGTLGVLQLPAQESGRRGSITTLYATVNVSHNWFGGRLFPFVTGGLGLYGVDEDVARDGDRDHLALGINGGGGVEVRLGDSWTLRLEGLVHVLTGDEPSPLAAASLGLKYYF